MKTKKLLLVDDDGLILATFGKGLKDIGYEVSLAYSGEQALRLAANEPPPDLAILDIRMPGQSGFETAQGLKHLGIPSIFLSAYNDETYIKQAVAEGALGYLIKPVDVEKMIPTIETALERAQEIQHLQDANKRLDGALETGNLVNVVVGMLMQRHHLGRQDAFELLRRKARTDRRKVKNVAEDILAAWDIFNQLTTKTQKNPKGL
ncbi:MAG TPA: response regulator [Gammaproteobacteria bacterium]|nr:response regulator [Gammaproteobacteria bacterium]